jgi:hypothetical protein
MKGSRSPAKGSSLMAKGRTQGTKGQRLTTKGPSHPPARKTLPSDGLEHATDGMG